jgi:hypothetical protein
MKNEAPERIYAKYSDAEPYNGKRGLIIDNEPFEGSQEFVRRPRVKPLVWNRPLRSSNPSHSPNTAITPFGIYYANDHRFWLEGYESIACKNRDAAKAAAQADYERRFWEMVE